MLLAAGQGSRLGQPKALIVVGGQSLARRGIALLQPAAPGRSSSSPARPVPAFSVRLVLTLAAPSTPRTMPGLPAAPARSAATWPG